MDRRSLSGFHLQHFVQLHCFWTFCISDEKLSTNVTGVSLAFVSPLLFSRYSLVLFQLYLFQLYSTLDHCSQGIDTQISLNFQDASLIFIILANISIIRVIFLLLMRTLAGVLTCAHNFLGFLYSIPSPMFLQIVQGVDESILPSVFLLAQTIFTWEPQKFQFNFSNVFSESLLGMCL